jgi:hypothetical protein
MPPPLDDSAVADIFHLPVSVFFVLDNWMPHVLPENWKVILESEGHV